MTTKNTEDWKRFATPIKFSEIDKKRPKEPTVTFYLLNTHFETNWPLNDVVQNINELFQGDAFALSGTNTVIEETGFSWKMRQKNIPQDFCNEYYDQTYCSTAIHLFKKDKQSGIFIVEGVCLNGNRNLFVQNWQKVKHAFGVEI